jgi:hypothetical protein
MLRRVALVRTDVWGELSASIIRVTRISELGTLTSTWHTLQRNTSENLKSYMEIYNSENFKERGYLGDLDVDGKLQ